MTNTITATQVLEMLDKARRLYIDYDVFDAEEYGHFIQFKVDWFGDEFGTYSYEKVFINNTNESDGYGGWDVLSFTSVLDEKLEEQEQEKIKAEKRQELIARLTNEERELLGLDGSKSVPHKSQMPF